MATGKTWAAVTGLLPSLFLGACSVVGVRDTPEPPSTVVAHVGRVEIRHYLPGAAAETKVGGSELAARSIGFQRLFAYITGRNATRDKIAMTAPVAQAAASRIPMTAPVSQSRAPGGGFVVRFFLPPGMTVETAPRPLDPRVAIVTVPGRLMAVLRFSGQPTPSSVAAEGRRLDAALAPSAWQADGPLVAWFYDPPWTLPPFRRNEVARPVAAVAAPPASSAPAPAPAPAGPGGAG